MDYEDNDFEGHNLLLTGEGNSEFTPVQQSYALPKFEFDQGHLRFDSLVESEVFLDIESREGNHWIEEFSPRAAKSCSISRRNNAWSEATSSESVEMLLKSVGQDMIKEQTVTMTSDVIDDLTNQMEPTGKLDNDIPIIEDTVDLSPTVSSGEVLGSFPQLTEDMGEAMKGDDTFHTGEVVASGFISSSIFNSPSGSDKKSSLVAVSLLDVRNYSDVNFIEVFPLHESPGNIPENLLKCVEQEEKITGKAINIESNNHDNRCELMNLVEPSLKHNNLLTKTEDTINFGSTASSVDFSESFPQLIKDVGGETTQYEITLRPHENEQCAYISSNNFDSQPVGENPDIRDLEVSSLDYANRNDMDRTEVVSVSEVSVNELGVLLNPAGHEIISGQITIMESDSHDEGGNLIKSMEHIGIHETNILSIARDTIDTVSTTVLSNEFLERGSHLIGRVEGKAMQDEDTSQICEDGTSAYSSSTKLPSQALNEKSVLPLMEGNLLDNSNSNDVNPSEIIFTHESQRSRLETITRETVITELDASDEGADSVNPMELTMKHDNYSFPKVNDTIDSALTFEFAGSFSLLIEDVRVATKCHDPIHIQEDESDDISAGRSDLLLVSGDPILPVIELSSLDDRNCNNVSHTKVFSIHVSPSKMDDFLGEAQGNNDNYDIGELNNKETSTHVFHKKADLQNDNADGVEKHDILNDKDQIDDQSLMTVESHTTNKTENTTCMVSMVDAIVQTKVVEGNCKNVGPSTMILEEHDETKQSSFCEDKGDQCKGCMHDDSPVVLVDIPSEGLGYDDSNSNVVNCTLVGVNMNSTTQGNQCSIVDKSKDLLRVGDQMDIENFASNFETLPLSTVDCKLTAVTGYIEMVRDPHLSLVFPDSKNFKDLTNISRIYRDDLKSEDATSSYSLDYSGKTNVQNYDQNESVIDIRDKKLPTDTASVECQDVGTIITEVILGSPFSAKTNTEDDTQLDKSGSSTPTWHESVLDLPAQDGLINNGITKDKHNETSSLLLLRSLQLDEKDEISTNLCVESSLSNLKNSPDECRVVDDVLSVALPSQDDLTDNVVIEKKHNETSSLLVVGSFHLDEKEDIATKICAESSLSTVKNSSEETHSSDVVLTGEGGTFCGRDELLVSLAVDQPPSSCNEAQTEVNKVTQEVSEEYYGCSIVCNSEVMDARDSEATLPTKTDGTTKTGFEEASRKNLDCSFIPSDLPADSTTPVLQNVGSEKRNCGSPTVISCIDLSHNEKVQGNKGPMDNNVSACAFSDGSVNKDHHVFPDLKGHDSSIDDKNFTFEVIPVLDMSEQESGKSWQPFSSAQAFHNLNIVQCSHASSINQMNCENSLESVHGNPSTSNREPARDGSKGTPLKRKRASVKSMEKETTNHPKDATPVRVPESGIKFLGMPHYGHVQQNDAKPIGDLTTLSSDLPDLNALASLPSPRMFLHPCTDLQQVQLRAQIFVYGSLIQGIAPEEAHMVSAFGATDGGRSIWENTWRTYEEMRHGKKSPHSNNATPIECSSGARLLDLASKHGTHQIKVISTPGGRANNKINLSTTVNSMVGLSSPLWSVSTPSSDGAHHSSAMSRGTNLDYHQALSPLHSYQTPSVRNFVGHAPWLSQAPFPPPWFTSQQASSLDVGDRTIPLTELVRLTPVKESSLYRSDIKQVSSSPLIQNVSVGIPFTGISSLVDVKKATMSNHKSPRKRKKAIVSEDPTYISSLTQTQTEFVGKTIETVVSKTSESLVTKPLTLAFTKTDTDKPPVLISPTLTPDIVKFVNRDIEQNTLSSEETLSKVKEAKVQAEEAALHASDAVIHCQEIWTQLEKEKNSGLISEIEAALSSAAVTAAAACAIAKAAAAAAKIASNAALHAKLMANEAQLSQSNKNFPDGVINLGNMTPIIVVAREAARKRVEAALAASKRAENVDALVKAAELAAEAVSQTGIVVSMGDPLVLDQLVDTGPEGSKFHQISSYLEIKSKDANIDIMTVEDSVKDPDITYHSEKQFEKIETHACHGKQTISGDVFRESMKDNTKLVDETLELASKKERKLWDQKGRKVFDLAKTIGVGPKFEMGSRSTAITDHNESEEAVESWKEDSIREGSLVEVFKDGDGYKAAWFLANVLSLKDGIAWLCYTELPSDEGSGYLKEWVALNSQGNDAPRIRIARPLITTRIDGTRKRQRESMGHYIWCIGDRVDAWIRDCWCEGIIIEKNKMDVTAFTVHFQARRETLVIRAWQLRPSLVWKDGDWNKWPSSGKTILSSHEGDTPREKRQRIRSPVVETEEIVDSSKNVNILESGNLELSGLLPLSVNEKVFHAGKNSVDGTKSNKPGSRKEDSKVIFGIPKPGKKRKFMDVSKHYIGDPGNKASEVGDSFKPKYLMSQIPGSRVPSRLDFKAKQSEESMSKIVKSGNTKDHDNQDENLSRRHNPPNFKSVANNQVGMSTTNAKSDVNIGKLSKIEEVKVFTSQAEPRRSNRRIQPTSRLLEGLQSSMTIIPKILSASHDKGQKAPSKNVSRGKNFKF